MLVVFQHCLCCLPLQLPSPIADQNHGVICCLVPPHFAICTIFVLVLRSPSLLPLLFLSSSTAAATTAVVIPTAVAIYPWSIFTAAIFVHCRCCCHHCLPSSTAAASVVVIVVVIVVHHYPLSSNAAATAALVVHGTVLQCMAYRLPLPSQSLIIIWSSCHCCHRLPWFLDLLSHCCQC
jgi:hypothetical protein